MRLRRFMKPLAGAAVLIVLLGVGILTRQQWLERLFPPKDSKAAEAPSSAAGDVTQVRLSEQAQKNLRLNPQPLQFTPFARTIEVPGTIVDTPGLSDRGVTSPVAGVVVEIHAFPRDTLRAGDPLFTVRLASEYVQNAQAELVKTMRDIAFNRERWNRVKETATEAARIEIENEHRHLLDRQKTLRHDLQLRGLALDQIDGVQKGELVTTIDVKAPPPHPSQSALVARLDAKDDVLAYEVQELQVELGQQVQAGQSLADLANHQKLLIEGRAFKNDLPAIEGAARNGWPIEVEFLGDESPREKGQSFTIHSLGSVADRDSNTLPFYVPLTNRAEPIERDSETVLVWRYRPGQRVRLHVPVEPKKDQLVLPAAAVVRDGPEAYVFRQNGKLYDRKPVHVLHEDRRQVVIANDGSVPPGVHVSFHGAAALNRALKAQKSSGAPAGFHVHADGSIHANPE